MTPEDRSPAGWDPWDGVEAQPAPAPRPGAGTPADATPDIGDGGRLAVPQPGDVVDLAELDDLTAGPPARSAVTVDQLVADIPAGRGHAPRPAPRSRTPESDPAPRSSRERSGSGFGTGGSGSFGKRSGGSGFGKGGSGSFGKRSGGSGFGDSGSGSFGRRSSRSGTRAEGASWGIQLDAEVEEPVPGPEAAPDDTAAGPGAGGSAAREPGRGSTGNRGRAGSFDRPRRAEGEPPAVLDDPEQVARQLCLTALTGTAKTRQQLTDMLAARDVPADAAEAVLDRFVEVGLVDDAAYAAAWVTSRQCGRGLSKRALGQELRAKGVDPEVAAVALEAVDPQDEWDTARALVAKKVPAMRRLDAVTATRRLVGMLARKGYGGGLAAIVVREALEADGAIEDAAAEVDDAPPEIDGAPVGRDQPGVPRGLWSGRPVEDAAGSEVGEGLTLDAVARSRTSARPRG